MKKTLLSIVSVAVVSIVSLPAGAASARAPKSEPVKIGSILPIDSPGLSLEHRAVALEAAVKGFNRRGGIDGRKFELTICDSKLDPNKEVQCAREMVDANVVATVGDTTTTNSDGVDAVLREAGISRLDLLPSGFADFQSPVAFPMYPGPIGAFAAVAVDLIERGEKAIALIVNDVAAAGAFGAMLEPAITQAGGAFVETIRVPESATDYSQYVAAAEAAGAAGVLVALNDAQATQFMKTAAQLSAELVFGTTPDAFDAVQMAQLGRPAKNAAFASSFPAPTESLKKWPGLKQFLADMRAFDSSLTPRKLKTDQVGVWLGVLALVTVMEGEPTIDAAGVLHKLETAQDIDLGGLIPPWTPSRQGPGIFKRISNPYTYSMTFDGRIFHTIESAIDAFALFPPQ